MASSVKTVQYLAYEQGWEDADLGRTFEGDTFDLGAEREAYRHGWNLRKTVNLSRGKQLQPVRGARVVIY